MDNSLNEYKAKFQRLLELREDRDITAAAAKKAEREYRELEAELFAELDDAGIRGRHEFDFGGSLGVAKFQRRATKRAQVLDKATAIASLRALGLDDVIDDMAIRRGRLNEKIRDWLEAGDEIPEGIGFYEQKGISISRPKANQSSSTDF